jgi:hypothetical protein
VMIVADVPGTVVLGQCHMGSPYFWGRTAAFGALRFLWSLSAGNHKNSRSIPHITEWQLPREDLDDQHRKGEDIRLFRTRGLSIPFLAWWVDKFRGYPLPAAPGVIAIIKAWLDCIKAWLDCIAIRP